MGQKTSLCSRTDSSLEEMYLNQSQFGIKALKGKKLVSRMTQHSRRTNMTFAISQASGKENSQISTKIHSQESFNTDGYSQFGTGKKIIKILEKGMNSNNKVKISWQYGGQIVFLVSSFDGWSVKHQLIQDEQQPKMFFIELEVCSGVHYFYFIVDDIFRFAPELPTLQHGESSKILNLLEIETSTLPQLSRVQSPNQQNIDDGGSFALSSSILEALNGSYICKHEPIDLVFSPQKSHCLMTQTDDFYNCN